VAAMSYAMIDLYCASYARPPREVTFDIDDTVDVVHGTQAHLIRGAHAVDAV
jgi:acid phosphatase class B